jgi:hypothetical protein
MKKLLPNRDEICRDCEMSPADVDSVIEELLACGMIEDAGERDGQTLYRATELGLRVLQGGMPDLSQMKH